jgi:hypothetical protein
MTTDPMHATELEERAAMQRQRLHDSVAELRTNVRGHLDVQKAAQTYLWQASAAAALVSLALGYAIGGAFTD